MDKAPDFGSGDCRFESCHGRLEWSPLIRLFENPKSKTTLIATAFNCYIAATSIIRHSWASSLPVAVTWLWLHSNHFHSAVSRYLTSHGLPQCQVLPSRRWTCDDVPWNSSLRWRGYLPEKSLPFARYGGCSTWTRVGLGEGWSISLQREVLAAGARRTIGCKRAR